MRRDEFWSHVDKTSDCWLWTAGRSGPGYAHFWDSVTGKNRLAHIHAYEELVGQIPPSMELDHSCFVPHCVNPDHLTPVTHQMNGQNRKGAPSNSTTGIRGVAIHKCGKWRAYATLNDKQYHFGLFVDIRDAERAAIAGRQRLYGATAGDG